MGIISRDPTALHPDGSTDDGENEHANLHVEPSQSVRNIGPAAAGNQARFDRNARHNEDYVSGDEDDLPARPRRSQAQQERACRQSSRASQVSAGRDPVESSSSYESCNLFPSNHSASSEQYNHSLSNCIQGASVGSSYAISGEDPIDQVANNRGMSNASAIHPDMNDFSRSRVRRSRGASQGLPDVRESEWSTGMNCSGPESTSNTCLAVGTTTAGHFPQTPQASAESHGSHGSYAGGRSVERSMDDSSRDQ